MKVDLDELEKMDLQNVKLMWVNYPHMPTGSNAEKRLFEDLITFGLKHEILIVNDNPYSFILNDKPQSILSVPGAKEIAIELTVNNAGEVQGQALATVSGMQDGAVVYVWSLNVYDYIGKGDTIFNFPAYTATSAGEISWSVTIHDVDPDIDEARNALIEDLLFSQILSKVGFVKGVGRATPSRPGPA